MSYYIQVTFDTEGIKKKYLNASQNSDSPTEIGESHCYMVASSRGLTGTTTRQLSLTNGAGNKVRFYGTSASNNFEDATIIYSIARLSSHHIKYYTPVFIDNIAIYPAEQDTLPPNIIDNIPFYFLESKAWSQGEKAHEISFAIYQRDNFGNPVLYGYFKYSAIFNIHIEH